MTDEEPDPIVELLSRRRFVGGVAGGAALLAGCGGSGDDGTEEPNETYTPVDTNDVTIIDGTEEPAGDSGVENSLPGEDGPTPDYETSARQMEDLDRGLVAVSVEDGVLVRWRLLGTEPPDLGFHVYRDGERVTDEPITESTNYLDPDGDQSASYTVRPVADGEEGQESQAVDVWADNYLRIPLNKPADAEDPGDGSPVEYHANDASIADLDGDGEYEIVQQWSPWNAKDNSQDGPTNQTILDGYTLDGEHLWRIELGRNVRAGAHYTQFIVYDFDGDGKAELAVRTADGTVDGTGEVIGDPDADYRDPSGRINEGPEFLTVFDGETGEALVTQDFEPARGDLTDWGDDYGNRSDRFLAGVAYLDGERPSFIMARGYYEKSTLAAYDYRDGELTQRWFFDSTEGNEEYGGQGNHQLSIADVDGDGKDEIVYGACVIDHDGTGLYSTGWNHGDALHVGDFLPSREGLEVFQPHEWGRWGATLRDAATGDLLWGKEADEDVGRAMIADVDPDYEGAEFWASHGVGYWSPEGDELGSEITSLNFGVWWTGDRLRELLDHDWQGDGVGIPKIDRWDHETGRLENLVTFEGMRSNNWTKGTPCVSGDILGDWREEVVLREEDSEALRLYVTPHETEHRIPTLMHDPQYRCAIAWQNVAYNQPPHPSFHVGPEMDDPPRPNIDLVGADD